ncbi:MAG: hypothetical protein ABJN75_12155 [Hoeflea sp.]|uniref:hypothetical protein n=1 Tax=Hoeflea sp. TaxID=1940281 RepID=UPI003297C21B|tara:strand:- start:2285 stop:2821 length:537 start_codon:yes stop_codon:yes gene_type:complete
MMEIYRPAFVAFVAILASGCQTASLEDAAPKPAAADSQAVSSVPGTMVDQADVESANAQEQTTPQEPAPEPAAPTVIRRNPGVMSVIPIEKTTPVEKKDFVATGARQTGQYPSFGRMPKAANSQLTEAQKLAAEAEMTELLRSRAATPGARAQYERRLKELRALAASHGSDTQREIEK